MPAAAPYGNTTFTFANSATEITLVFMRAPLLTDEAMMALNKKAVDGIATVKGHVVASVSLPHSTAIEFAKKILSTIHAVGDDK